MCFFGERIGGRKKNNSLVFWLFRMGNVSLTGISVGEERELLLCFTYTVEYKIGFTGKFSIY